MRLIFVAIISAIFLMAQPLPSKLANHMDRGLVIVDFFASWCHSCRKELPLLLKFTQKHPNIKVIAVSVDEDKNAAKNFVKELNIQLPILYDTDGKIVSYFNPVGIPALYIFKDKKLQGSIIGAKETFLDILTNKIKALQ